MGIEAEYRRRLAEMMEEFARASNTARALLLSVLGVSALTLALGVKVAYGWFGAKWLVVPVVVLIVLEPFWQKARSALRRSVRLVEFYERGLGRLDGSAVQSGRTGEAFFEAGHLYARDLNVLGPDSLFGMLATTRTAVGQRALAGLLLHGASMPAGAVPQGLKPGFVASENVRAEARTLQREAPTLQSEVRARQEAVRELAPMLDLRERVALLGRSAFEELPAESFDRWLNAPPGGLAVWMRWVLIALTVAWVAVWVGGHGVGTLRNVAAVMAVQGAFALWLRPRVMAELEAAQRLEGQTAILREGLKALQEETFSAALLLQLQKDASGGERALRSLSPSLMLVEQRVKEWFYVPALVLGLGSHAAISLEVWKREHGEAMRRWVKAWAEFEAMVALGMYAAEHPANVYPEMVEGVRFEMEGLAHPLLIGAVANDVRLDEETRFLLISGSNMAGKSTLLRAMGCNAVMGLAGAPVCARAATMSALRVGASLALVDSLAEGKSKFLAEVERLRDLVALAREGACLFLIDEIFSGTNSADRRVAAEAVLRGLLREGAVGALSTHDLALAELGEVSELRGRNVHMASADESDPLGFDYLLKAGVNRTTNALAIVRMLGLAE